jgi:hypothetical protein
VLIGTNKGHSRCGANSGATLEKSEDFRRYADECRARARATPNDHDRAYLLDLAKAWEALAADRDRLLEQQKRSETFGGETATNLRNSDA